MIETILKYAAVERGSEYYPQGLYALNDEAPDAIYTHGNLDALSGIGSSLFLTGSRASTGYGEHVTMEISSALAERGVVVANGGAYGIAGMALRAQLASDIAPIVWLAGGIDRFYPSGHQTLFQRVVDAGGVIVSAQFAGESPTKERLNLRNKYLAAASGALLVAEAGVNSESIRAAQYASKYGKRVMAVPGPVTSAASSGCHNLIRSGIASIVTNVHDVLEEIGE